jgi:hypothetical protein
MIDKRIEAIDIDDGSKIVLLRPGYCYGDDNRQDDACHTFGADTHAEIRREMKRVKPCSCHACQKALNGTGRLWS